MFERFKAHTKEEIENLTISAFTMPEIQILIDFTAFKARDRLLAEGYFLKQMTVEQAAEYADVCVSTSRRHKPFLAQKILETARRIVPYWDDTTT